jgi:pyruvate-formate lyase-activating enzyme
MNREEWSPEHKWNPFNSFKLLSHIERWQYIDESYTKQPHPALVTIDPINLCNLNCSWCNSQKILKERSRKIEGELLLDIGEFLSNWKSSYPFPGVRAICIAGGGEPLLHNRIGDFINYVTSRGIEVGVVTNGTLIHKHIPSLSKCTWVGVSVDAGTSKTFRETKGKNYFDEIINNMEELIQFSHRNKRRLSFDRPGYGVTYKYLLHPNNIFEVGEAADIASRIGCKNLHIRPYGIPWNKLGEEKSEFSQTMVQQFFRQIESSRKHLESPSFGIYGVIHKFDPDTFSRNNNFKKCHALFMTGVFMPGKTNGYTFGLCCDRRGDSNLELICDSERPQDVEEIWGSRKHWEIFDKIQVINCPRCTYQPHNQIFEKVILEDSMTWKFI